MQEFADALAKLTWAEMNRVALILDEEVSHRIKNDEPIDPHWFGMILSEMAEGISKEAAAIAAEAATAK